MKAREHLSTGSGASARQAIEIFLVFAFAYFFSALLRAVTATLAPNFSAELQLSASDLGLLAGAYFIGFSALQLPLGAALDRHGPRRVILVLTSLAVLGCAAFAMAETLWSLVAARVLIGMGLAAGLMAPLTCYRLRFSPDAQLRANAWMLMTGSLGMLASTLPVQWLLPAWGWRGLFWGLAACLLLAMAGIAWRIPRDAPRPLKTHVVAGEPAGYRAVFRHRAFVLYGPLAFFVYGGLIAVQTLWAGPWLTRMAGFSSQQAAAGLFVINLCMLGAFLGWGLVMPRLSALGLSAQRLMTWGLALNPLILGGILLWPSAVGPWPWALWCVSCTFVSLSQPLVGQSFPAAQAGRALSAFNLVIFAGVFCLQWGIGLVIDGLVWAGWEYPAAFRSALGLFGLACLASYLWFLFASRGETSGRADNPPAPPTSS